MHWKHKSHRNMVSPYVCICAAHTHPLIHSHLIGMVSYTHTHTQSGQHDGHTRNHDGLHSHTHTQWNSTKDINKVTNYQLVDWQDHQSDHSLSEQSSWPSRPETGAPKKQATMRSCPSRNSQSQETTMRSWPRNSKSQESSYNQADIVERVTECGDGINVGAGEDKGKVC